MRSFLPCNDPKSRGRPMTKPFDIGPTGVQSQATMATDPLFARPDAESEGTREESCQYARASRSSQGVSWTWTFPRLV